jgi:hypothetical protein
VHRDAGELPLGAAEVTQRGFDVVAPVVDAQVSGGGSGW